MYSFQLDVSPTLTGYGYPHNYRQPSVQDRAEYTQYKGDTMGMEMEMECGVRVIEDTDSSGSLPPPIFTAVRVRYGVTAQVYLYCSPNFPRCFSILRLSLFYLSLSVSQCKDLRDQQLLSRDPQI